MARVGSSRRGFGTWWALAAVLAALLPGCGGGGGESGSVAAPAATATTGQLTIGVRDAADDFLNYTVDVTSLRLERANGAVVETVPLTTRIDFAALVDLTEFLTIATVPTGAYSRVVVGLDFTNAQIVAQDANGAAVPVVAVGTDGRPLTTLAVAIELPADGVVRIAAGVPAAVTLDFDLAASNVLDLAATPPNVTVQPFLAVVPELEADRAHRARGLLAAVDESEGNLTLKVRPFHLRRGEFGRLTVATTTDTRWEIDGEAFAGAAGLAASAALAVDTPVVAQGTVVDGEFTAAVVLAGSSVPWANGDALSGVVTARSGDTLTVRRADLHRRDGTRDVRGAIDVIVGDGTRVTAPGAEALDAEALDAEALDDSAISVGQRIVAFGTIVDAQTLDATAGWVRLEVTPLAGAVVQVSPLVVDLVALGGLRIGAFDFTGTGAAAADADPTRYEIDTLALTLPDLAVADHVRVRGLVHTFGLAPPDFDARTVIASDADPMGVQFHANWRAALAGDPPATGNPFTNLSASRIDIDLTDARHQLRGRGEQESADRIALIATADSHGIYTTVVRGSRDVKVYRDFAELSRALSKRIDASYRVVEIGAIGRYNASTLELTTPRASFEFAAP